MYKWVVIEIERKRSQLIILSSTGPLPIVTEKCWEIRYSVPFPEEPGGEVLAFNACIAWIENNKVDGSKYVVQDMYFYE